MGPGQSQERIHVSSLAVQVDRNNRFRFRRDQTRDVGWINVVRVSLNVSEDRHCSQQADRVSGRNKAERGNNYLVTRADSARLQAQDQRIGSGSDAHGVLRAAVFGNLLLQGFYFRAQDEVLVFEHRVNSGLDLFLNGGILRLEIKDWNGHSGCGCGAHGNLCKALSDDFCTCHALCIPLAKDSSTLGACKWLITNMMPFHPGSADW